MYVVEIPGVSLSSLVSSVVHFFCSLCAAYRLLLAVSYLYLHVCVIPLSRCVCRSVPSDSNLSLLRLRVRTTRACVSLSFFSSSAFAD